jgi:hypothetical protein
LIFASSTVRLMSHRVRSRALIPQLDPLPLYQLIRESTGQKAAGGLHISEATLTGDHSDAAEGGSGPQP